MYPVIEHSLSSTPLTSAEESGHTARAVGLKPSRITTPPREVPQAWSVRYAHPPLPSDRRAAPRRFAH